jgi:hypothetical protein
VTYVQNLPVLNVPAISLNGAILTWDACDNTTGIHVYVNGNYFTSVDALYPFFDLRFLRRPSGSSNQVQIKAVDGQGNHAVSALSGSATYIPDGSEAVAFAAPRISLRGNTLTWDLIENAQVYSVYVNNAYVTSFWFNSGTTASLDIRSLNLKAGDTIQVRTETRYGLYRNSILSNRVTFGNFIRGDVNGDGKIDIEDILMVLDHIFEVRFLTGSALVAADVNGDGRIDIEDVLMILDHIFEVRMLF